MAAILTVPLMAQTPGSGKVYISDSTVSLVEFGVSFQVPQGWTAAAQDQPGAFMLASAAGNVIGFLFFKAKVSDNEMKAFFADKTDGILRLEQTPVAGYNQGWVFDFRDAGVGVQGTGRAVLSTSSTAALVIVMAKTIPPESLAAPAEAWVRALRFAGGAKPVDTAQSQAKAPPVKPAQSNAPTVPAPNPFSGRQIHGVKSYRGGDYFELTTISVDLCVDGTYSAIIKKESSSTSGLLGPSQKTDHETGTWSISGAAPQWALTLRTSEGLSNSVPLRTAGGLRFGDMPAELLQTMNCR
ncbi:MAG: hypothetical protein ABI833_14170 [Acidobacteriota bacterium]